MKYNEFDNPKQTPTPKERPIDVKDLGDRLEKAKANTFKKPESGFDFSKLWGKEKDVTEYRNVVTPRDEAHYRELMKHLQDMELDPTNRRDSDLMAEIRRRRMELRNWAEQNIKREDATLDDKTEGFIGKKPQYTGFLQNKLDQAIQEFDTPEKQKARAELMKHYLAKGGTIEKVPAGQKAFVGKKLKPAYKKDNGTPTTSPGSDESAVKEEAPFGSGMDLIRMAVQRKFISAEEYMNYAKELKAAGEEVANGPHYADWPDGEGFGSSDGNFAIKQMMDTAGYEFDEQDRTGRFVVTKMPEKLAKLGITNVRMRKEPVATEDEGDSIPRLLGKAEAGLEYGLELATHVGKKEYGIAEQVASIIRQNWPSLIAKIKNIYKTEDDSEASNGLQPVDLKRLGQSEPKIYVHKDGKTITIPKRKHNEYIAKGWKQSSLKAETQSYKSKLTDMLDKRLK